MHETYADTSIAFVDAKVAAAMCKGGVIAYLVDEMSGITDKWILDHVVPNMVRHGIDEQVCKVLGCSVLWRLFDRSGDDAFPPYRRDQIMSAYRDLGARNVLEEGCNPVKRKPLIVSGHDTEVLIDLLLDDSDEITPGVDLRRSLAVRNQEVRLLSSQIIHMRRELVDARAEADRQIGILKRQIARMSNNISRIANRPSHHFMKLPNVQPGGPAEPGRSTLNPEGQDPVQTVTATHAVEEGSRGRDEFMEDVPAQLEARLTKCPKTLHDLWKEYEFGFCGCKPAKDFTSNERGKDRYNYYRRNVFWSQVSLMIRAGYTAETACDKIYFVYGASLPVSKIIKLMIRDKKYGGHLALRVVAA